MPLTTNDQRAESAEAFGPRNLAVSAAGPATEADVAWLQITPLAQNPAALVGQLKEWAA